MAAAARIRYQMHMNIPLQITFRHMEASPALEQRIRTLAQRLEHFSAHIMR